MKASPTWLLLGLLIDWRVANAYPEAIQVTESRVALLPQGKEAEGVIGDWVLRNESVEAVISGKLPGREAALPQFGDASSAGCLFDLARRGGSNDQITVFSPCTQHGLVAEVRAVPGLPLDEAAVEVIVNPTGAEKVYRRHEYRVKSGEPGVLISTTLRNEGEQCSVHVADRWTSFPSSGEAFGIHWADAADPADKAGYAYAWLESEGSISPAREVMLAPRQEIHIVRFLTVGRSPAEAFGLVASRRESTGVVQGIVRDERKLPLPAATVALIHGRIRIPGYPDGQGRFSFAVLPETYEVEFAQAGRPSIRKTITVAAGQVAGLDVCLEAASAIEFDIRDEQGRSLPCKAQFIGRYPTPNPDLGPVYRAHGCRDQYHSETGQFRVQLPRGRYGVIVTRGPEYSHLARPVELAAGETVRVTGVLRRLVDTRGWISADFHNHATPGGDSMCGVDDRIINLAAEHIEFAPATEHNRFYDWEPHIRRLGLQDEVKSVVGIELTGPGYHLNAFPFRSIPHVLNGGAPAWQRDPRTNAVRLREWQGPEPDRWVQLNHPDLTGAFVSRTGAAEPDGGDFGSGALLDGVETQNGMSTAILTPAPFRIIRGDRGREHLRYVDEFTWLQILNRGLGSRSVTASDAHAVFGNGVGGWRMYLPSRTDRPGDVDWREVIRHAKAGQIILTTGPFLEVQTADGTGPGGETSCSGTLPLRIRVQCTDWIDIDRVQVLVNGRQPSALNFTRESHASWFGSGVVKFDHTVNVPLREDSQLIVVACGERSDLSTGYGSSEQAILQPCAYHQPIRVDVNGDGFKPNHDTLDWPLVLGRISVEQAKAMLEQRGQ